MVGARKPTTTKYYIAVGTFPKSNRPQICSLCRKHFPVLSPFITYHNTMGTTSGTGTAALPEHLGSLPVFNGFLLLDL
jgi:hypothetical protein